LEVRKEYQIEITNRFAALENLSHNEDIDRGWKSIKRNIKTSAIKSPILHALNQLNLDLM
jgi:hypothetical protein